VGILQKEGDVPFMPKEEGSEIWGTDGQVLCPYGSFKQITRPWMIENTDWRISVDDHLPLIAAEDLLKANLRRVRGLRGDDADNFQLETNRKLVEQMEKTTRTLMLGSAAMVSISLLVGGIGVMNIMLVSVTERTREIGIRKALGARKRAILAQFLVEAVVLCLAGGLLGILSGLGLGSALSRWVMHQVGAVPFWTLGAALGVPILVGLTFGLYPANRAAGLDAIESLRYE
jgi:putative ABC transport system permease protein